MDGIVLDQDRSVAGFGLMVSNGVLTMNRSSGDPIADRRYAYAVGAAKDGDWRTASEVLEQALERASGWSPAWLALGEAREKQGDISGAVAAYRAALTFDRDDSLGAGPRLAQLEGVSPQALPTAYVRTLFDDYAPHFAHHLVDTLDYRGPTLVSEALEAATSHRRFAHAMDLGCGDGLTGKALRPRADRLTGVDVSTVMIERARRRMIYDELIVSELGAYLVASPPGVADLIVAADVLPYVGELGRLFAGVARGLAPQGMFACTGEADDGEGFRLGARLRFSHSKKYLIEEAKRAGLGLSGWRDSSARRENGHDVPGWVGVFSRLG
jgi:predicted TPR repeat methyltransferase